MLHDLIKGKVVHLNKPPILAILEYLTSSTIYPDFDKMLFTFLNFLFETTIFLEIEKRLEFISQLNRLPRIASKGRILNRCILTGRSKSVYRFCKLSRLTLRDLGSRGLIPGLSKKSW